MSEEKKEVKIEFNKELMEQVKDLHADLKKHERLIIKKNFSYVEDKDGHMIRAYAYMKGEWYEIKLEKALDKVADFLKDKLDPYDFLKEWLRSMLEPDYLLDLVCRVEKKAAVRRRHCYALDVYGERKPFRIALIRP